MINVLTNEIVTGGPWDVRCHYISSARDNNMYVQYIMFMNPKKKSVARFVNKLIIAYTILCMILYIKTLINTMSMHPWHPRVT